MGSCHVLGYPETVGPSLPDSLWVSEWQPHGSAVSANRPHALFSREEEEGKKEEKGGGSSSELFQLHNLL